MNFNFLLKIIKNLEIYKFLLVGIINAMIIIILIGFFTKILEIFYLYSAIISYEITIILGFFVHEHWTFSKMPKTKKKYIRLLNYNVFSLIGLGMNIGILLFLTEKLNFHYMISELIAIISVFVFNFISSKKITFRN